LLMVIVPEFRVLVVPHQNCQISRTPFQYPVIQKIFLLVAVAYQNCQILRKSYRLAGV